MTVLQLDRRSRYHSQEVSFDPEKVQSFQIHRKKAGVPDTSVSLLQGSAESEEDSRYRKPCAVSGSGNTMHFVIAEARDEKVYQFG